MKIAYCIPALYYPSGMERVLTLKANYFAEVFGYEIHIILTDGKGKKPYYELHPSITLHQLDIDYDELNEMSWRAHHASVDELGMYSEISVTKEELFRRYIPMTINLLFGRL